MRLSLHHISLSVRDLAVANRFYGDVLRLPEIPRPDLGFAGAWYGVGDHQIHLIEAQAAPWVPATLNSRDGHIAFATTDFDRAFARLEAAGFSANLPPRDPRYLYLNKPSRAGFAQLFVRDPDGHLLEINAAVA